MLTDPIEPLARFAFDRAPDLCAPEHGCCAYHRAWSMIRWLMKDGLLPAGQDFFATHLAQVARHGRCRVLLSGAADAGLAAMVLGALAGQGLRADLVLAERCATPIAQNRQFMEQLGHPIELHHGDILTLDCAPVDAVIAHSFINFLPADLRPALVAHWARLLRPGGVVLLHQKLGGGGSGDTLAGVAASRQRLEAAARARGVAPDLIAQIGQAGEAFWLQPRPAHRLEAEELHEMLAAAGFEAPQITALDRVSTGSPRYLPGVSSRVAQSLVCARKPA